MISIENELFTLVATALRTAYSGIYVAGEYVPQPPAFPAVFIVERDNSVYQAGRDSGGIEHFASVMYEVDVYSNLARGKKAQAKEIISAVDAVMAAHGFTRTFLSPVQNYNDASIYRMTARYTGVVGTDKTVYRR